MREQSLERLPSLVVRASAGAGKTYQLTTRYLQLLARGEPMQHVLATTFTRKASGEVLARVLGRLAQACSDETPRRQLSAALKVDALSRQDCVGMLRALIDGLNRLAVGTIDGFFNRAARAMSLELNLPAEPRLIDEGSPLARQMRADAIHAVLGEQAASDQGFAALIDMLRRLHHDTAQRSVTDAIDSIVVQLDEVYRSYPDRRLWDQFPETGRLTQEQLSTATDLLQQMEADLPVKADGDLYTAFAKTYRSLLDDAQAARWEHVLANGLIKKVIADEPKYNHAPISEDWRQILQAFAAHAKALRIRSLADQTLATYDLLALFSQQYQAMRIGQGVLLFSDLTHVLAQGLPNMGEAGVEELCYRLDARVTHLLLDEFQDTSLTQWQVLRPFAEQIAAEGDGSRSLFCVGDTKQAIYGWRGGCAELFDAVEALPGVERDDLSDSWRSSQVVLDAVNEVFSSLDSNAALKDCPAAAGAWQAGYQTHHAVKLALPGHVVLQTTRSDSDSDSADDDPADENDDAAPPDAHARYVADYVKRLTRSMPGRSIGVLVRRRKSALQFMHELRGLGVHAAEEGGNPIDNIPAVSAVLSAIQLADHPGDSVARFHVINSPVAQVVGLSPAATAGETHAVARRIRQSLIDKGYAAVIGGWVQQLAPSCDARSLRRLMQLVELAEQFDEHDAGLRPGFFVDSARVATVEDPSPALVRVMTIHAAKGLEFDAVVLADLDSVLSGSDARGLIVLDRDSPIEPVRGVYRRADKQTMSLLPRLESALAEHTREKRTEDLCLLYVAMTRARQALHLLVRPLGRKKDGKPSSKGLVNLSYAAILRQALAPDVNEGYEGDERLYESGDPHWPGEPKPAEQAASVERPQDEIRKPIRLARPDKAHRRSWAQATPSALHDAGAVDVLDLLRLNSSAGRSYGTLMHKLFEQVGFIDESMPDQSQLQQQLAGHADPAVESSRVLHAFTGALLTPAIVALLSRNNASELWRERRFICRVDGTLVNGTFDRVHLWREDENGKYTQALLIDFKTDQVDDQTVDAVADGYVGQIALYRRALSSMLGLDLRQIEARLCFVGAGRVVAVD